ncbi:MAG TPA: MarR family transcriptional regulator [Chthonomonadaceae bacterium]|nr:MarR family transcriptional regulator [Chthonomonadaceae bacterium]
MGGLNNSRAFASLQGCCGKVEPLPPASALHNEPLPRLFKAVEQAFRQQALQQMRAEGIADVFPGATPLILHLGEEDGLTLSELGKRCGLESSTITPLVDELERHQIAVRARDPADRRVVRLYLTEYGRSLAPRLRGLLLRLQEVALAGISEEELAALRRTLERIAANLNSLDSSE